LRILKFVRSRAPGLAEENKFAAKLSTRALLLQLVNDERQDVNFAFA
jgi:hypothetical protein